MSEREPVSSADELPDAGGPVGRPVGLNNTAACQRVRAWLLQQADAAEFRDACREAGVPVAQARKAARLAQKRG